MTTQIKWHQITYSKCLAASVITWVPLFVLAHLAGEATGDPGLRPLLVDLSTDVRLLIALPILLHAVPFTRPRLQSVIDYLADSEILTGKDRDEFDNASGDFARWYDLRSVLTGTVVVAILFSMATFILMLNGENISWFSDGTGDLSGASAAGWWYGAVSLPIWHFAALRCLILFVNWWIFLGRLARLDLELVPIHPDRCGGIGILEMGHLSFVLMVAGAGTILSASLAESLIAGSISSQASIPYIAIFVLMCLFVVMLPLLGFVPVLVHAKRSGLVTYGDLGEGLFRAFGKKWGGLSNAQQADMVGSADPSSLSDYGYCYEVVAAMRSIVLGRHGMVAVAMGGLLPFVPLLFIVHSFTEVLERLLGVGG